MRTLAIILVSFLYVACTSTPEEIQKEVLLETTTAWDGQPLPAYPTTQPKITILKITIPPNTKLAEHYHAIINCAVITKGTLKVVKKDGQELIIKEGEAVAEVLNDVH